MKFKHGTRRGAMEYEKDIAEQWKKNKTFEKSVEQRPSDNSFVFYDGPPFITGAPHYGTLLSSIVKDCIPRYQTMRGKRVERRWGWDCHGLPAENFTEKHLGGTVSRKIDGRPDELVLKTGDRTTEMSLAEYNTTARELMVANSEIWESYIDRIGRWVDFKGAYKTMNKDYMESVWWAFKELYDKGLIYEGEKVLMYDTKFATPVSKNEVTMDNDAYQTVTDPSVYVKFHLKPDQEYADGKYKTHDKVYIIAWTTTPWTLPANTALAVGSNINYTALRINGVKELLIVASSRVEEVFKGHEIEIVHDDIKGNDLAGLEYGPLWLSFNDKTAAHKVYAADFVEDEGGTGIVHIAPAYGEDDFALAKENDIPVLHTINDNGYYDKSTSDWLRGIGVRDTDENGIEVWAANKHIAKCLEEQGIAWKIEYIRHEYPFNPRSGQRIMYRAIPSWFFDIQGQKPMMLEQNENIYWFPTHIKNGRFAKNIEAAPDWNLSRDRFWATAMPVWKANTATGSWPVDDEGNLRDMSSDGDEFNGLKPVIKVFGDYEELEKYSRQTLKDYHRPWVDEVEFSAWVNKKDAKDIKPFVYDANGQLQPQGVDYVQIPFKRIDKVLDCWFESGSMPFAQMHYPFENKTEFEANYPADFISEYTPQVRAWFYYVHTVNTALADIGAFGDKANRLDEIKNRDDLIKTVQAIVEKAVELKNKYTDEEGVPVSYACIFCQSDDEYERLVKLVGGFGKEVENHGSGPLFELDESFLTIAGELKLVKIRKYDDQHKDWGHADFVVKNYGEFKKKHYDKDGWSVIARNSEILELIEKDFPVRAYFPELPIGEQLGVEQDGSARLAVNATVQKNAFKNCIVTGTIAGEDGRKMSKSLGNYTDPNELMDKFSADSLRFLLLSSPLLSGEDFALKDKEVGDVARKLSMIWNVYDFFTMYAEVDEWRLPDTASEDVLSRKVPAINLSELKNVLDIWIISRLHELVTEITRHMDEYNTPDAMSGILPFVDDLSNWFVRRSRRRFWKSEDDTDKNDAYRTLHYTLVYLSQILAPFVPFLSEELYQKMTCGESVHLLDWPESGEIDKKVLNNMTRTREIIEKGLALRMERDDEFGQIKVRQPLAKLEYSGDKLDDFYEQIIADEVNVKSVNNGKELTLDKNITPELRREGQAREIIRVIQNARKEAGLNVDDRIVVNLTTSDRDLKQVIDEYRDIIAAEILAIKFAPNDGYETSAKIDNMELIIQLQKDVQ